MTQKLLKNILSEAQTKKQIGLFIWANWTVWDNYVLEVKPGNDNYDFAISKISKGEEATISSNWNGLSMPGFIAVSVQKLLSSEKLFNLVLDYCNKGNYIGPVTLVPLNEVSDFS